MTSIEPLREVDDDYDSEADDDFEPDGAPAQEADVSSSSDEDADACQSHKRRVTKRKESADDSLDFDNSGDEATISKAHKRRRKANEADANDDEGGEGGLIKTRAQRKAESHEKEAVVSTEQSSVDVDTLWAQMSGPASASTAVEPANQHSTFASANDEHPIKEFNGDDQVTPNTKAHFVPDQSNQDEPTVTIKRRIDFAGQVSEEERRVPVSSAEAKLYLQQQKQLQDTSSAPKPGLRRPTKRKSAFDQTNAQASSDKGKKLTTLEKSKLDWAAQVDKEGLATELEDQSRGKSDYLGRMDFLSRMDAKRDGKG